MSVKIKGTLPKPEPWMADGRCLPPEQDPFVDQRDAVLRHPDTADIAALTTALQLAGRGIGATGDPHLMGHRAQPLALLVLDVLQHTGWALTRIEGTGP